MDDKVLVKLYVPKIEKIYDLWIPSHKKIYNVIVLLIKAINEINYNIESVTEMPGLYDKITGEKYNEMLSIKESTIRSGAELILI